MKVSTHAKSQVVGLLDQATGFGLKSGLVVTAVALVFLLVVVFGGHLSGSAKTADREQAYLADSVELATQVLVIAAVVAVVSLVVRFPREELLGQALSLGGAVLYFGVPLLLGWTVDAVFLSIVKSIRSAGTIALLPGLTLVLRDAILRIWTGVSVKRVLERRWGDEEEQRRKKRKPKLLANCWDMEFCRDFVRKVCPAAEARKSCWRVKVGCYCDERTILKAMTSGGKDNIYAQGIMKSLELDKPAATKASNKMRRERCRRCMIYAEHQRQKYRLLSPMVFPVVLLLLHVFYGQVSSVAWMVLERADRFMRFLTYRPHGSAYTFSDDGQVLTVLAVAWLTIIVISYSLRALEYLVFELQV